MSFSYFFEGYTARILTYYTVSVAATNKGRIPYQIIISSEKRKIVYATVHQLPYTMFTCPNEREGIFDIFKMDEKTDK